MLTTAVVVVYLLIALIAGRLGYNQAINEEYDKALEAAQSSRWRKPGQQYLLTVEEHSLQRAKERVTNDLGYTLVILAIGWFWPVVGAGYLVYILFKFLIRVMRLSDALKSRAERQVESVLEDKARRNQLEADERDLRVKRAELKKLAKSLDIPTEGLDAL